MKQNRGRQTSIKYYSKKNSWDEKKISSNKSINPQGRVNSTFVHE